MVLIAKKGSWLERLVGRHSAKTIFPFIIVKEDYKDNKGLIEHEKVHIRQVLLGRGFLYYFSAEWKYKLEMEAYQKQLWANMAEYKEIYKEKSEEEYKSHYMDRARQYANYLASNYGLPNGTYERAIKEFIMHYHS